MKKINPKPKRISFISIPIMVKSTQLKAKILQKSLMILKSVKTSSKSTNNSFNNNLSISSPNKSITLHPYRLDSVTSKKYYFPITSSYSIKSPFFPICLLNLLNLHKISPLTQEESIILILKTGKLIQ